MGNSHLCWAVDIESMKSVVDKSNLDYLLHSRHSYTSAQRSALASDSFEDGVSDISINGSALKDDNSHAYDALIPGIFVILAEPVLTATTKNEKDFRGFYEAFRAQFMGAVSMTRLIMINMAAVSISSRFTSRKVNYLATYIHNRDFHNEFLETHTGERCSEMSNATTLISTCKYATWIQLTCTVFVSAPTIIGSYEATKNHLISHVPANTIAGRSGASIGQVATNTLEISKSECNAHVSDTSNNDLLGKMP